MRKYTLIILAAGFISLAVSGCGKKEPIPEQNQEPAVMEETMATSAVNVQPASLTASSATEPKQEALNIEIQPQALAPVENYKPSVEEIQAALKNAGLYSGSVDGKVGPKTKQAIEDFQKANGLKADGVVGPMTWGVLSKHLSSSAGAAGASQESAEAPAAAKQQ